jgi:hypothetical protein
MILGELCSRLPFLDPVRSSLELLGGYDTLRIVDTQLLSHMHWSVDISEDKSTRLYQALTTRKGEIRHDCRIHPVCQTSDLISSPPLPF